VFSKSARQKGRANVPRRLQILLVLSLSLSAIAGGAPQERPTVAPAFRHGYYLFLADPPVACEACYVPLLITADTLEETAKHAPGQDCVLVTTYERDSIWQINGMVHVEPTDIQLAPRTISMRRRSYRYQEITADEILKLLEHPLGTIPISRPFLHSDLPPGPSLETLIADFRAVK
jgi:hypothetical protein